MLNFLKKVTLAALTLILAVPFCSCKEESNITLADKLMQEAQIVTDFMRDEGFIYGDAKINPGINWEHLDPEKAIDPNEKIVSCDRLVDWILYRAGFTNQVYQNGMNVWSLIPWCEDHNFEKITDVSILQAGDIVFVNPDLNNMPQHVFMCGSSIDENGNYLRYDAGSNERIQCKKGTEVKEGHQPFLEPIGGFMYAYRPNDSTLEKKYSNSDGAVLTNTIDISIEIPKGSATIDGIISKDEYKTKYTMDNSNSHTWVGSIGDNKTDLYFSWDDKGLYYAAEIFDDSPSYKTNKENWVGVDCLQIGINPGNLISKGDMCGIFLTFGAEADGNVVVFRNNYSEGLIKDEISAYATGHFEGSKSYIIEAFIPWETIKLNTDCASDGRTIDTTSFKPTDGTKFNILPCVINAKKSSTAISAAYKFKGTGFTVANYVPCTLVE